MKEKRSEKKLPPLTPCPYSVVLNDWLTVQVIVDLHMVDEKLVVLHCPLSRNDLLQHFCWIRSFGWVSQSIFLSKFWFKTLILIPKVLFKASSKSNPPSVFLIHFEVQLDLCMKECYFKRLTVLTPCSLGDPLTKSDQPSYLQSLIALIHTCHWILVKSYAWQYLTEQPPDEPVWT